MAYSIFSDAKVYLGPNLLSKETKVSVKRSTGSQPIHTVNEGYAGESKGSGMTEIEVSNAVPSADFEADPGKFMKNLDKVTLTIVAAGRTLVVDGCIHSDNFSHQVDSPSGLDFSFRGPYADWE